MLLTLQEVAERLRVSMSTLNRLLNLGCLTRVRVGQQVRIEESDLTNYLNRSKEVSNV